MIEGDWAKGIGEDVKGSSALSDADGEKQKAESRKQKLGDRRQRGNAERLKC
jgi:hypothetical protein